MIGAIIEWSARNRFAVLLAVAVGVGFGVHALRNLPLDAIPDLSDPQVIVYTEWPGRSPDLLEAQVTYPIVSALLATPGVSAVRGTSDYGVSYVHVIFDEGTDLYWGRTRVLEAMDRVRRALPDGVSPALGPDATGVGWVFEYALVDRSGQHDLAELRSFNDWTLRYWLASVPGVAEVATIGGFVKQYQVNVDPARLLALGVSLERVIDVLRRSNRDVGGRAVELSGREYVVRGRGQIRSLDDIASLPLGADAQGTPIQIRHVADVVIGAEMRRGIAELDGTGEVTGGIVIARHGQNALALIERVQARIAEVQPGFPSGVELVPTYDRSDLIRRSIATLVRTLAEELLLVSLVIVVFLRHLPSAIVPIVTIPVAVILGFIPMYASGMSSNIMSLAGIAIAVGALVDAAIVVVEQTHKKLERWEAQGRRGDPRRVIIDAVKEVGGPSFFSLLVIAVAFLPIFALQAQEGRLFRPLAFTKNASIAIAALLAITFDPVLRLVLARFEPFRFAPRGLSSLLNRLFVGRFEPEEATWINRVLMALYRPVLLAVLRHRAATLLATLCLMALTVPVFLRLGSEFMPPLNEGSLLYMPITLPGISVTEAGRYLQLQDRLLRTFPEVQSVFGKVGRAGTATDPAPLSMVETTVVLRPEAQWRTVRRELWYWPWPVERRIRLEELVEEMDRVVRVPAFANAWLFPVRTRVDMTTTGVRTPLAVKVLGSDLAEIERIGLELERVLQRVPGTRSAFFERLNGGSYLDFEVRPEQAARYGLASGAVNDIVESAIGGSTVTTVIEGRERYPVHVRYARGLRDDLAELRRVLVPTASGAQIPLGELAAIELRPGPAMLRNEQGFTAGYVYVDVAGRDLGSYVRDARAAVAAVVLPPGYRLVWSGQYEYLERVRARLALVVPLTLAIILLLLYLNTGSAVKTAIVALAVPFSAVGAIGLVAWLGYDLSIAVWVGLIALLGVDAETGVFMLLYLDLAHARARAEGRLRNPAELREAVLEGAVQRLRPKVMTAVVMLAGLAPILASSGAGSDVMQRIAAPMIGGIVTSFLLELLVYPVLFELWKERELSRLPT